jgi:hypothetical protein
MMNPPVQIVIVPYPVPVASLSRGWWEKCGRDLSPRQGKTIAPWRPAQTIPDRARLLDLARRDIAERRER